MFKARQTYIRSRESSKHLHCEINKYNKTSSDPALENCLFGAVSLPKNANTDRYQYSRYRIGVDRHGNFSFPGIELGRNVIVFGVDMNSLTKIHNRKKDILILGKGPTQGLEHTWVQKKCIQLILQSAIKHSVKFEL